MMDLNPSEPVWQKQKAEEWYPPSDLAVRLVQINSLRENWLHKPISQLNWNQNIFSLIMAH